MAWGCPHVLDDLRGGGCHHHASLGRRQHPSQGLRWPHLQEGKAPESKSGSERRGKESQRLWARGGVAAEIPNLSASQKQQGWELRNDVNHPHGFVSKGCPGLRSRRGPVPPETHTHTPLLAVSLLLLPKLSRDASRSVQKQRLVKPWRSSCPYFSPCELWVCLCWQGECRSAQGRVRRLPDRELTALQVLLLLYKILGRLLNKRLPSPLDHARCRAYSRTGRQTDVVCTTEK